MTRASLLGCGSALLLVGGLAPAGDTDCPSTGPDVLVHDIFDTVTWGTSGGEVAFTMGTNACNIGDEVLNWVGNTSEHPLISQALYRVRDDRIEQIGTAWLKHGFGALQNPGCGCTCQPADYQHLGVGCADPYDANINGVQTWLGPRREVNPYTGDFPFPPSGWGQTGGILDRRLRVEIADVDPLSNEGATYLVEAHYISRADAAAGNSGNNTSWRSCTVETPSSNYYVLELTGETQNGDTAVQAWGALDPEVRVEQIEVPGDGRIVVGSRVSEVKKGWYRYTWAVQNVTCNRAIGGLWMGINLGAATSMPEFNLVKLHGEFVDDEPWAHEHDGEVLRWETDAFEVNPNANAIRWGLTATFVIETNAPPVSGSMQLSLFKPGGESWVSVDGVVPGPGTIDPCDLAVGPCPWELDGVPGVNGADLTVLLSEWGVCGDGTFRPGSDINGDCCVDGGDLAELLGSWGVDCTPVGACCFPDGSCVDGFTDSSCVALGGDYRGDDIACAETTCPESGSCCLPDGTCVDDFFAVACLESGGIFSLELECAELNCIYGSDECRDAPPIIEGIHLYSTLEATSGGLDHLECETGGDGGDVGNDIWFTYEASGDGLLHLSTCGTVDYDSELLVYGGDDCAEAVLLGCNDDASGCSGYTSDLLVEVEQGEHYLIRVGGWRDGSRGRGELLVELIDDVVSADDCADAIEIGEGLHVFSTVSATTDGPVHAECKLFDGGVTAHDIWFIHVATGTGLLEVSTCGLVDYDSDLVVYDGIDCSDLVLLGCNDDTEGCAEYSSYLQVPVVEGESYLIRVGGWTTGSFGSGELSIQFIGE